MPGLPLLPTMVPAAHSQLQDEHHVGAVLKDVMQRDDVGMQHLPQDAHLPLDVLPAHAPPAGPALPLLDELGCVLQPSALLPALLHNGKLAAVGTQTRTIRVSLGPSGTLIQSPSASSAQILHQPASHLALSQWLR